MEAKKYRPLERSHAKARVAPGTRWPARARMALILPVLMALLAPAGTMFAASTPPVILLAVQGQVQPGSPEPGQQAETPAPEPAASAEDTEEAWRGICVGLSCLILVAVLFGFVAMFPVWYVQRQQERRTLPPDSR